VAARGLGLVGVATGGDVALCHRFAESDAHKLAPWRTGSIAHAQQAFLEQASLANKTDCSICWAGFLSGGCYTRRTRGTAIRATESPLLRVDSRMDRCVA